MDDIIDVLRPCMGLRSLSSLFQKHSPAAAMLYYHIDSIFARPSSRTIHALNVSEIACYIGFMCDWLSQEPTAIIYAPESFCVKRGTPI